MRIWLFPLILVLASSYVWLRGGREERSVLATLLLNFLLTYLFFLNGGRDWLTTNWSIAFVDAAAFLILFWISLRSKRFWPLPIAALQFLPILTPFVAMMGKNIVSYALGMTQGFWGWLQLIILVIATKRHRDRQASLMKN
jgi:hypothetical protein